MSGTVATTLPGTVTTLSTGYTPITVIADRIAPATTQVVIRALRGMGRATTAAVGDSNSSSAASARRVMVTDMIVAPSFSLLRCGEMAVLLMPEVLIDRAALQQIRVRADVDDAPLVHHQDGVAVGER
jgi:hypothetical protein